MSAQYPLRNKTFELGNIKLGVLCSNCGCPYGEHWGKGDSPEDTNCPIYPNEWKESLNKSNPIK